MAWSIGATDDDARGGGGAELLRGGKRTFSAITATSSVSQPSVLAKVRASFSFPKTKSALGMVSMRQALKGGTSIRKGADRFWRGGKGRRGASSDPDQSDHQSDHHQAERLLVGPLLNLESLAVNPRLPAVQAEQGNEANARCSRSCWSRSSRRRRASWSRGRTS